MRINHPPCGVCGCQDVGVLANAVAGAIIRLQTMEQRVDADLDLDHKRGPLHDGSHDGCLVCEALGVGAP